MTNNSTFNPTGKTPSQILNHYFGNNMPQVLKDNPFLVDVMGWTLASNPIVGSMPGNHLSIQNYFGSKITEATKEAWKTGNIWKFFDYNFYHIPGYKNLNKVWGGGNIKGALDFLFGIKSNGNMSVGDALLNVASIIPIGRGASIGGKLLSRFLPKVASTLMKRGAVQTILKGAGKHLKWGKSIFQKLPKRWPSLSDIGNRIRKISDLINLEPKAWIETTTAIGRGAVKAGKWLKNTKIGHKVGELGNLVKNSRVGRKVSAAGSWLKKKAVRVFDKLVLGKITQKDLTNIVSGGINIISKGAKGAVDSVADIFPDMTNTTVKYFVHRSPWRIKKLGWLKKVTSSKNYRNAHKILGPIIKRNTALRSFRDATKKVRDAYNKYAKPIAKAVSSIKRSVYSGAKNAWRGVTSWLGFKGPAGPSTSSSFTPRASGFTYQGYSGSRQSIAETMNCMSGNCVDGTLAQVALAQSFGIPAKMIATTWNGNPHVYGRINGVDRDIANHALTGSWSAPPAGPGESNTAKEIHLHIKGDVYGLPDFENKVKGVAEKYLDREIGFANQY